MLRDFKNLKELEDAIQDVSDKVDNQKYQVVESGSNELGHWRIWSDGYMEQWGFSKYYSWGVTVNMPKSFNNNSYLVQATHIYGNAPQGASYGVAFKQVNGSTFGIQGRLYENSHAWPFIGITGWKATGYITK